MLLPLILGSQGVKLQGGSSPPVPMDLLESFCFDNMCKVYNADSRNETNKQKIIQQH